MSYTPPTEPSFHMCIPQCCKTANTFIWHNFIFIFRFSLVPYSPAKPIQMKAKSRKYQGAFGLKSRVKTWQVRGIWSQQFEHKKVPQWWQVCHSSRVIVSYRYYILKVSDGLRDRAIAFNRVSINFFPSMSASKLVFIIFSNIRR